MEPQRRGGAEIDLNKLTERVIGACVEIHRHLGPGLLESAYVEGVMRVVNYFKEAPRPKL